jgi:hypothetical protein
MNIAKLKDAVEIEIFLRDCRQPLNENNLAELEKVALRSIASGNKKKVREGNNLLTQIKHARSIQALEVKKSSSSAAK